MTSSKKAPSAALVPAVEPAPAVPEKKPAPESAKKRGVEAERRVKEREHRAEVSVTMQANKIASVGAPHDDGLGWQYTMQDAFGTSSLPFVTAELDRLANSLRDRDAQGAKEGTLNAALAAIDGTRPENEMSAMLASQMVATHSLAMDLLGRTKRAEFVEQTQTFGGLAVKLLRTFTAQTEALAKLKRGGEQTVRVEHVHVHAGAQAIVGAVTNHPVGVGATLKQERQPHETIDPRALAFAPGAAMWGADEGRDALPEGGVEREDEVPTARRR